VIPAPLQAPHEPTIERWLNVPANAKRSFAPRRAEPRGNPRCDRASYRSLKGSSQRVFSRYIELFSTKRRRVVLGSGHK
jgi:hypothetical protein